MLDPDATPCNTGHAMAELAADKAGESWKTAAYEGFKSFAKAHPQFTTEQARASVPGQAYINAKAWGAIALRARREGVTQAIGNVKVQGGRMIATLWQSNIFTPTV